MKGLLKDFNKRINEYACARAIGITRRPFPDMKALENVETTMALLSSLPVRSAKTQLAHWYTQKTKCSLTTAVLRALVQKTTTVTRAERLVQLGTDTLGDPLYIPLLTPTSAKRSQTGLRSRYREKLVALNRT